MNIVYENQVQTKVNSAFKLPIENYTYEIIRLECWSELKNNYESFKS